MQVTRNPDKTKFTYNYQGIAFDGKGFCGNNNSGNNNSS